MREVYGSQQRSAAPLRKLQGELLTDNEAINMRWSEHFQQLLNRSSSLDHNLVEEIPANPYIWSLVTHPGREAIDELQYGESAGRDGIPPEVLKVGGQTLISSLSSFVYAGRVAVNPKI